MRMDTAIKLLVTFLVVTLAGCASDGNVVRCDGRLEPINTPEPLEISAAEPVDLSESESWRLGRE